MKLMELAGLSQAETARLLGITPSAVSQICSGDTRPRPSTFNLLKLQVGHRNPKVLDLFDKLKRPAVGAWEARALELVRSVPPAYRDWFLETVRGMLKNLPEISRSRARREPTLGAGD